MACNNSNIWKTFDAEEEHDSAVGVYEGRSSIHDLGSVTERSSSRVDLTFICLQRGVE